MNDQQIRRWLRLGGFHRPLNLRGHMVATATDRVLEAMVRKAQEFHGLVVDGNPGPITQTLMQHPRCGCPDYPKLEPNKLSSRKVPAFGEACRLSVGVYADWDGIQGATPAHATEVMVANFRQADRFNLRMVMVDDPLDALINIRMGKAEPGVLAWMEVGDDCGWQHQSLFNIDVDWSNELLLAGTIMHEVVGHGAGVGHTRTQNSIMAPMYDPSVPNVIGPWFSNELVKRYGLSGLPQPTPTPQPSPNPGVKGMTWAEIIAIVLPLIIECIQGGADDTQVEAALRSPNAFQYRLVRVGVKQHVKETRPELRGRRKRRERRAYVDGLLDSLIHRGFEASPEEIQSVVRHARQKAAA